MDENDNVVPMKHARPTYGDSLHDLIGFACGHCRTIHMLEHLKDAEARANACCTGGLARDAEFCRAIEADKFSRARKISIAQYDGEYLYIEGAPNGGFVATASISDALADLVRDGKSIPAYAWACTPIRAHFDVKHALTSELREMSSNIEDWVDDETLHAAHLVANSALKEVQIHHERDDLAVLLPVVAR